MYDLEIKTNKLHNTIIGRLMALFVTGVVCLTQAIPVFADDDTKTKLNFSTTNSLYVITEQTMYFTEPSYDDIVVPVYINLTGNELNYISGTLHANTTAFNFIDGNNNRYVISYFEASEEYIHVHYDKTYSVYTIFFDNVLMRSGNRFLIGYMHLMGNPAGNTLTLTCSNYSQNANIEYDYVYSTTYEWGYVNASIYALDNSTNLTDMLNILNNIETSSLPDILTVMRSNHTALYNLIQNVWTTDQAVLSVNRDIYNTVLSILAILEDQYTSQASNVEDIKDHVQTELNNARQDMELTKPSQVANLADDYIEQIDTQYNYSVFSWLTAPTFILMMCIVAALAIISYMLYGGQ